MTRAIDRLIVSGAIDDAPRHADRLGARRGSTATRSSPAPRRRSSSSATERTFLVRVDRAAAPRRPRARAGPSSARPGSSRSSPSCRRRRRRAATGCRSSLPRPAPPLHRVRRLSYSALALFERCSYRYYAERVAGLRERARRVRAGGAGGLAATEIGDAVHRLLELVDLADAAAADVERVRTWYPAVTDEELERIGAFVAAYCESELARARRRARGRAAGAPVRVRARRRAAPRPARRAPARRRPRARPRLQDERARRARRRRSSSRRTTACSGSSTRSRASGPAPTRSRSSTRSSSVPTPSSRRRFARGDLRGLEAELSAAIARIDAGEFVPSPDEFTCSGLPRARRRLRRAAAPRRTRAARGAGRRLDTLERKVVRERPRGEVSE